MQNEQKTRSRAGKIASAVGIFVNLILAVAKMSVGAIFGIISIVADGLNNLTDCASSLLSLLSFKLSRKPADKEHPFGHERIEYVFSMVVAFIILFVSFETAKESFNKILFPEGAEFSYVALLILIGSIFVKCTLYLYYRRTAKRINSQMLSAAAADSLGDCVSTAGVLISLIVSKLSGVDIDGYAGIFVALFIAWTGIGVLRNAFSYLIGRAPDEEMIANIKERILAYDGVLGVHDILVYSYGPSKYYASVHIEVDASVDVLVSHELVDLIERDFALNTSVMLTGHLDPIIVDDERVNTLRGRLDSFVKALDGRFSIHDFRMVRGPRHTNLIFDLVIPFEMSGQTKELKQRIDQRVQFEGKQYFTVITFDLQAFN